MVREQLAKVINGQLDVCVCAEAGDHHGALEAIAAREPVLAVIDLNLNGSSGLDLIKDIRARHPTLFMLVLSMYDESLYAERAFRAGAHGYITKQKATGDILVAIRKVLAGNIYMSDRLASEIACKVVGHRPLSPVTLDHLTDRELGIFDLIGQGHSMRHIADTLHLDIKTVETYRARIKKKLNLKDAGEVLQHAIRWSRVMGRC
jgi:DNA-binding NarL/FixJ family response regulator